MRREGWRDSSTFLDGESWIDIEIRGRWTKRTSDGQVKFKFNPIHGDGLKGLSLANLRSRYVDESRIGTTCRESGQLTRNCSHETLLAIFVVFSEPEY